MDSPIIFDSLTHNDIRFHIDHLGRDKIMGSENLKSFASGWHITILQEKEGKLAGFVHSRNRPYCVILIVVGTGI